MFNSLPTAMKAVVLAALVGKLAVTTATCYDKHFKKKTQPVDELLEIQASKNKLMEEYIHLTKLEMESRERSSGWMQAAHEWQKSRMKFEEEPVLWINLADKKWLEELCFLIFSV